MVSWSEIFLLSKVEWQSYIGLWAGVCFGLVLLQRWEWVAVHIRCVVCVHYRGRSGSAFIENQWSERQLLIWLPFRVWWVPEAMCHWLISLKTDCYHGYRTISLFLGVLNFYVFSVSSFSLLSTKVSGETIRGYPDVLNYCWFF